MNDQQFDVIVRAKAFKNGGVVVLGLAAFHGQALPRSVRCAQESLPPT